MSRLLGLLGGMSWESTALYYRLINQQVAARRGGLHSAPLLLHSIDFAPLAAMQQQGRWHEAEALLGDAARGLRGAGAGALVIASNTMHKSAAAIEAAAGLPLLHIADATGDAAARAGARTLALLGTRFTMEDESIVVARLRERHRLQVLTPPEPDRAEVHRVIYEELCRGVVADRSREAYLAVIERLRQRGAEGVVLGCTEITMLIDARHSPLPVFDTTALHAAAAAEWLLAGG